MNCVARCSLKVRALSSHAEGNSSCVPDRGQRKFSQDRRKWHNVQDQLVLFALVNHFGINIAQPSWRFQKCNYAKYACYVYYGYYDTWAPSPSIFLQHGDESTVVLLTAIVIIRDEREEKQHFAEPHIVHSELKSTSRYSRGSNKHIVLTIYSPQSI